MGRFTDFISNLFTTSKDRVPFENIYTTKSVTSIPPGRVSAPTFTTSSMFDIKSQVNFINPPFIASLIPVIRKLSWINADVGLAIHDMVQLTNTGHRIKFDPSVSPDQIDKMRQHILNRQEEWGDGTDGMNGLINRMISQLWISGALSSEWVISNRKDKIDNIALVNPETIIFKWVKYSKRFFAYQKQNWETGQQFGEKYVKLNPFTYKYYALNGDTEIPYGIPPLLTALNSLSTQADMDQNIRYIMKQVGLLGFFEMLMTKPYMIDGENEKQYASRLNSILAEGKKSVINGIGEGVVVGYKDDHEFNFNSTTKDLMGVTELYNQNEQQVANGLKIAGEFLGLSGSGSETGIGILFTKMLSQLQNIQKILEANLRYGYTLELRLAGFNFKNLRVEFNPSTITDELKYQQSQEYKIRNVANKYQLGVIGQQQMADELGYDKPDQKEPRGPLNDKGADQEKRQDQNDKSDKKIRDKAKPQPRRKDSK